MHCPRCTVLLAVPIPLAREPTSRSYWPLDAFQYSPYAHPPQRSGAVLDRAELSRQFQARCLSTPAVSLAMPTITSSGVSAGHQCCCPLTPATATAIYNQRERGEARNATVESRRGPRCGPGWYPDWGWEVLSSCGSDPSCGSCAGVCRFARVAVPVDLGYPLQSRGRCEAGSRVGERGCGPVEVSARSHFTPQVQPIQVGHELVAAEVGAGAVSEERSSSLVCDPHRRLAGARFSAHLSRCNPR